MSILVYIVSHPYTTSDTIAHPEDFGFRALKPAIAIYPQFLEMLVTRLSSADHALCANALQLINSLMREAITNNSESDWPKFIKRLQDLGVISAVYGLMQSSAMQDLSQPLLEFQALTKVLLRKWRDLPVELEKPDHRRALKSIHAASRPPEKPQTLMENGDEGAKKKIHDPEKWRRLGFETETPAWEFEDVGFLGMMDLTDYVRKHEDAFQNLLLEQSTRPAEQRCPVARASLAVTAILFEHFEIEKADVDDAKSHFAFESKSNFDKAFKPLILQWSVIHVAGLEAFFRLWNATGAVREDFNKIYDLVRILLEAVVGAATRTKDVQAVQTEIAEYQLPQLRQLQMELLELSHEDSWEVHLRQIKDELSHEALQFVKEQRIRCLLAGHWFPGSGHKESNGITANSENHFVTPAAFRYARLSPNRRFLHYADFDTRGDKDLETDGLSEKGKEHFIFSFVGRFYPGTMLMLRETVDLNMVSSVTSNVTAASAASSTSTLKEASNGVKSTTHSAQPTTKITIRGFAPLSISSSDSRPTTSKELSTSNHNAHTPSTTNTITTTRHERTPSRSHADQSSKETTLLVLHPQTPSLASEWLDGLLMLLNQQPITNETSKLIGMIRDYGLQIRLLNVRFEELGWAEGGGAQPEVPGREGLDEEYYYDVFGG